MNTFKKVLIGTPVHSSKDYAIKRWLQNVKMISYPADFFMVDNSPDANYVQVIRSYCAKYKIDNYEIEHIEVDQNLNPLIRVAKSQEVIRQKVISGNYDYWFSLECDQIVPENTLSRLIQLLNSGNFMAVAHNSWARWNSDRVNTDMGVTLIKKEALKNNWFLQDLSIYERCPDRINRLGGACIEVFGVINPIEHLNK